MPDPRDTRDTRPKSGRSSTLTGFTFLSVNPSTVLAFVVSASLSRRSFSFTSCAARPMFLANKETSEGCFPRGPRRWRSPGEQTGPSVLRVAGKDAESRLAGDREVFTQERLNDGFPRIVPHAVEDQHPDAPVRIAGQNRRQLALQLALQEADDASGPVGKRCRIGLDELRQAQIEGIQPLADPVAQRVRVPASVHRRSRKGTPAPPCSVHHLRRHAGHAGHGPHRVRAGGGRLCPLRAGAQSTIVVNFGRCALAEAAAYAETDVDWLDADATDDTACTQCFAAVELQR